MRRWSKAVGFAAILIPVVPRAAFADEPDDGATSASAESRPPEKPILRGLVSGGAGIASLFGISSTGGHLGGGLGLERGRLFLPFTLEGNLGVTEGGLGVGDVTLGVGAQAIMEPVRLGGGLDAGYAWIVRAPSSRLPHIGAYALDAFVLATVDLFAIGEKRAVYLGLKPSFGVRWGESIFAFDHGTLAWRGVAMIGARF